jgi:tetratricopeptide (TPR) repeat protein
MEQSQLGQKLAQGGEGEIFTTPNRSLVAKVYHQGKMTVEAEQKLRAMLANPPIDSMRLHGRVSIAWAVDLVTVNGIVKGYTMPLLEKAKDEHLSNPGANFSKCRDLIDFYNPSTRRKNFPWFHYGYLIKTARNIAIVTDSLHAKGYAIGDVNESNILVALDTIVTFVDTDSFQVPGQGKNFRCQVGKPEYTPPELQGVSFKEIDRTQAHDLFGLGVLIFQLLMQGQHPFAGKYQGQGETPEIKDRIKSGHFPHGHKQVPYAPIPMAPAFAILPLRLQELFIQCFETGHHAPEQRPTAQQWNQALGAAEQELKRCSINEHHFYAKHLSRCSWCDLAQKFSGRDPFPSQAEIQGGRQLQQPLTLVQPIASISPQTSTFIQPTTYTPVKSSLSLSSIALKSFKWNRLSGMSIPFSLRFGIVFFTMGVLGFGTIIFNKVTERNAEHAKYYNNLASTEQKNNDFSKALADYNKAIELDPRFALAYLNRGNLKAGSLDDVNGALADYNKAIELDPRFALAYYIRGYFINDVWKGLADYNKGFKLDPNYNDYYSKFYHDKYKLKNEIRGLSSSVASLNAKVELNPLSADTYIDRGYFKKSDLKDIPGALADYNKAIELNPANAIAYNERGLLKKSNLKDIPGALADYNKAIELNPANAIAYYNRGVLKKEQDLRDGAIQDFWQAVRLREQESPNRRLDLDLHITGRIDVQGESMTSQDSIGLRDIIGQIKKLGAYE